MPTPTTPPITLSETAADLLRRRLTGERVEITEQTRPYYRELVEAGLMIPLHTFAKGRDSAYRLTEAAPAWRAIAASSPVPSREAASAPLG